MRNFTNEAATLQREVKCYVMMKALCKTKHILLFLIISLLAVFSVFFIGCAVYFPNHIQIVAGTEQKLRFHLPVEAHISSESIGVLSVNNNPVDTNITVNLNETVALYADESGQATLTVNAFGIPVKKVMLDVVPAVEVIPCGMTIGVKISTDGIMVLGCGYVNGEDGSAHKPSEGILKSGDLILNANGEQLENKDQFIQIIEKSDAEVKLKLKRDDVVIDASVTPIVSVDDTKRKIGIWIRDSTQGIGTVTYYNPESGRFGALGHGILDVDTKKLMSLKTGEIRESKITAIKKGKKGSPGELVGEIKSNIIGEVKANSQFGIYGSIFNIKDSKLIKEKMKIAMQNEIHEGPAVILSNIEGNEIQEYDVYIESVNRYSSDDSKGLVLKITDPELLAKTNGIVQGMSGSPIIQENKVIGAVTHVFVQDPTKGYGIFIENMLKSEGQI